MGTKIEVKVGSALCKGELFDDLAPETARGFAAALPIIDRTIQVRWSGDAWRTEKNYELRPQGAPVENVAGRLSAGDIIYFPGWGSGNIKIGIAYGEAQWLGPFMVPVDVCHVGRLTDGIEDFVAVCQRVIFDGPLDVQINRAG